MKKKLLEHTVEELLKQIGAGRHIPGSGSAAALNALVSCKLLLTVAQLTLKKTKTNACIDECNKISTDIIERIELRLVHLFEEDSLNFDIVISRTKERNKESNQNSKNRIAKEVQEALITSTEIPLEIALLSLDLAEHAFYLIDNGFRDVRGDSSLAISSALSAIYGCLSIICLNLKSFPENIWTKSIKLQTTNIRIKYEKLYTEKMSKLDYLNEESKTENAYLAEILEMKTELYGKTHIQDYEIEHLATKIQRFLWRKRKTIWKDDTPTLPLQVLDPAIVIQLLNYEFLEFDSLGVNDLFEEIAGVIDNNIDRISVSKMYPNEVKKFTTAHELGHAIMHDELIIHRDRPLETRIKNPRLLIEKQADKFAACFLIPEKQLKLFFQEYFQTDQLNINQETAFALGFRSARALTDKTSDLRSLSRLIASTNFFHTSQFQSLAELFGVSIEAMAIRLEELDLVA